MVENQVEKDMENEMETGIMYCSIWKGSGLGTDNSRYNREILWSLT